MTVFARMWRFYLLSCAGAFRARSMQVYSILFSKEGSSLVDQPTSVRSARAVAPDDSTVMR